METEPHPPQLQPKLHRYHLDVEILSCNLFLRAVPGNAPPTEPAGAIETERLDNFYGLYQRPGVRRVRDVGRPDYGKAFDAEYSLEYLEERS